jgi:hypothetical protein
MELEAVMTDRELLELAAKAVGMDVHWGEAWQSEMMFRVIPRPNSPLVSNIEWNPLTDDGDALRLAVSLGIDLLFTAEDVEAIATQHARQEDQEMISPWACESWTRKPQDPYAATRRAIVRAAAEIGKQMEK